MFAFVASLWLSLSSVASTASPSNSLMACAGTEATCKASTLAAESVLLQMGGSTSSNSGQPGEDGPGGALEVDAPSDRSSGGDELEQDGSAEELCAAPCMFNGGNYSCSARIKWVLNQQKDVDIVAAVHSANAECKGQCMCNETQFAQPGSSGGEDEEGPCYTAQVGEQCYKAVEWARTHGMRLHPERYDWLTAGASFEEFQDWLYKYRLEQCRRPCNVCHTALPGEACYDEVMAELGEEASDEAAFVDLQNMLSMQAGNTTCPVPCGPCHTAAPGEQCFTGVTWAKTHGIKLEPETYPGLDAGSSLEEFQEVLYGLHLERCARPCRALAPGTTSRSGQQSTMQATTSVEPEAPASTSAAVPAGPPPATTAMPPPASSTSAAATMPPASASTTTVPIPPVSASSTTTLAAATSSAAASSTTEPEEEPLSEVLALQLSVAGLSYASLAADAMLQTEFKDAMTSVIAGAFVVADDRVVVSLSPGSVVVHARVTLDAGAATFGTDTADLRRVLEQVVATRARDAVFKDAWTGAPSQISAIVDSLLEAILPPAPPSTPIPPATPPSTPPVTTGVTLAPASSTSAVASSTSPVAVDALPTTTQQTPGVCTSEASWSNLRVGNDEMPLVPNGPDGSVVMSDGAMRGGARTWQFDGTGYLGATLDEPLGSGDWTIEVWLKIPSDRPVDCWHTILSIGHGHETAGALTLYQPKNAKAGSGYVNTFAMFFNEMNATVGSHRRVNDDAWHHLALARSAGSTRLFVDGFEEFSMADNHTYTETDVYIGADPDCNESFFEGSLDSVRISPGVSLYPLPGCEAPDTTTVSNTATTTVMPMQTTESMSGPVGTEPPMDAPPVPVTSVSRGVHTFQSVNVTVDVELDPTAQIARIRLRGPSSGWYGVGFGAQGMEDEPYVIIVDGSSGTYQERKIGDYNAGTPLSSSLEELVDYTHVNGYCEVQLKRPLVGASEAHYTFDASVAHATVDVIAAFGESFSLAYHDAREVGQLTLARSDADVGSHHHHHQSSSVIRHQK